MKKVIFLILVLALSNVNAQVRRGNRTTSLRRNPPPASTLEATAPTAFRAPIFLKRQGPASIEEMMLEPPTFNYGSSINVWLAKNNLGEIREVAVTGHGDSATCRRVSAQVMAMLMGKTELPEDLFVAGAAHIIDKGDNEKKLKLEKLEIVEEYKGYKSLWVSLKFREMLRLKSPGAGTENETAVEKIRGELKMVEQKI